jgi:hypothetical protein
MIYDFLCSKCGNIQEEQCKVDDRLTFKPNCENCGGQCNYVFTPSIPQVVFKDGATGSWPSKGIHYQNFRRQQNEKMKKRQRDRYGEPKQLNPNFGGKVTESWAEAQSIALQEKGNESAATYDNKVKSEKTG